MLRIFPYYAQSKQGAQRTCVVSSSHMIYWHDFCPSSLCTFDLLNVWWWSLQVIHHHQSLQPHLTHASPNIRVRAADLRRMEQIYKFGPGGAHTSRLPSLQRGRWRQTRVGGWGHWETRRFREGTLCIELRIRRTRENFNSAAVATNKRPLINRDMCEVWVGGWGGGLTFGLTAAG